MPEYPKLVRDGAANSAVSIGHVPVVVHIPPEVRLPFLAAKFREEAAELTDEPGQWQLAELIEILMAMADLRGGWAAVDVMRKKRVAERGGYREGCYVIGSYKPDPAGRG